MDTCFFPLHQSPAILSLIELLKDWQQKLILLESVFPSQHHSKNVKVDVQKQAHIYGDLIQKAPYNKPIVLPNGLADFYPVSGVAILEKQKDDTIVWRQFMSGNEYHPTVTDTRKIRRSTFLSISSIPTDKISLDFLSLMVMLRIHPPKIDYTAHYFYELLLAQLGGENPETIPSCFYKQTKE